MDGLIITGLRLRTSSARAMIHSLTLPVLVTCSSQIFRATILIFLGSGPLAQDHIPLAP